VTSASSCLMPTLKAGRLEKRSTRTARRTFSFRQDNANLFIAECKFWSGPGAFAETINQLLRYVTWRETKTLSRSLAATRILARYCAR
jgi:hypothetical protein